MKFSFPNFKKNKPKNVRGKFFLLSEDNVIIGGTAFFGLVSVAVLLWSVFLFHQTVFSSQEVNFSASPASGISSRTIDDVVRRLNERDKNLKAVIAGSKDISVASTTTATSSATTK